MAGIRNGVACALLTAVVSAALPLVAGAATHAAACDTATFCDIEGGRYLIRMPGSWDGKNDVGAIVYFHGWQGSAEGVMRNAGLTKMASDLGIALVAVDGLNKTWSYPSSPSQHRDELTFLDRLLADIDMRHAIDMDRLMASGFSMGGSMAWYAACFRGKRFAGIAPVAGAFWEPLPDKCPSPAPYLFHVHGTTDTVVPIAGRPIGERWHQGDLYESLERFREKDNFQTGPSFRPEGTRLTCERQVSAEGSLIEVCLHPGGHNMRPEWVARAWRELSKARGWKG